MKRKTNLHIVGVQFECEMQINSNKVKIKPKVVLFFNGNLKRTFISDKKRKQKGHLLNKHVKVREHSL